MQKRANKQTTQQNRQQQIQHVVTTQKLQTNVVIVLAMPKQNETKRAKSLPKDK